MSGFDVPYQSVPEEEVLTPTAVHALLLLYTATEDEAATLAAAVKQLLPSHGVQVARELDLLLDVDGQGISREHFGFADGLSQPAPFGLAQPIDETVCVQLEGRPAQKHPVQGVPLGEFLIGYQNGHSEPAPGPVVTQEDKRTEASGLPPHALAEGFADLGLNGSYLVVRELRQDVAAFWQSLRENAERIRATDPGGASTDETWLAERVIGRGLDGHLLCPEPNGYLKADKYGLPDNDYLFSERDPHGFGCPVGSHVRRAFPRDALAPQPTQDSRETLLQAANNHRILRRGRKFGAKASDRFTPDGMDRGLLFMCLNTDIERQFEFVQQTWLLNNSFATLFDETDPLLGPAGVQTLRGRPVRRKVTVRSYVQMAGGDYFFLPSLPALAYLSLL
jgi:Dyp-type peroxidase family